MMIFNEDIEYIPLFAFAVVGLGPLIIHVVWCVQLASEYSENWNALVLLVAGVIVAPVGWVHGMSILLGFGGGYEPAGKQEC